MPFFTRIVGPFPRRGIKKSKVFGHCRYHGMDITFRQSKRMKCLEKNCRKLKPNWEHPEWKKIRSMVKGGILSESNQAQGNQ